jgi:pyrroloquinoline quinone biosynthesis protein B
VKIRILGTAAGGGAPQWNCACDACRATRSGASLSRTQDCLAISADGSAWYLVNASPDIRAQLLATPELAPGPGRRDTPLRGALLTTAELDHVLGLVMLREGSGLQVWAPAAPLAGLATGFPLKDVLDPYGSWAWNEVTPGEPFTLDGGALSVTAIAISTKRPRYAAGIDVAGPWVVAYRIADPATGGSLLYAPCLATWPDGFDDLVAGVDCVIVDGTFYSPDEMADATGKPPALTGQSLMGHLPIAGDEGSLAALGRHPGVRRLYTHLNNTNPAQHHDSAERMEITAAGVEVPDDGTLLEL